MLNKNVENDEAKKPGKRKTGKCKQKFTIKRDNYVKFTYKTSRKLKIIGNKYILSAGRVL